MYIKCMLGLILLITLGCVAPAPIPTPSPPPAALLDLPRQAWTKAGLYAWELPMVPLANNNSRNWTRGERFGSFPYGTEVTVERYEWSVPDQEFWIYLKQNDLEGWVSFHNAVSFDGPPQAEVTFQEINASLPIPKDSIILRMQDLDGRFIHNLVSACHRISIYGTERPIQDIVQEFHDQSFQAGWYFAERFDTLSDHHIKIRTPGSMAMLYSLNDPMPKGWTHPGDLPSSAAEYATIYEIRVMYFGPVSGCGWESSTD